MGGFFFRRGLRELLLRPGVGSLLVSGVIPQRGAQLRHFALQPRHPLLQAVDRMRDRRWHRHRRWRSVGCLGLLTQQLDVALLLLAGPALEDGDQPAADQPLERLVHPAEIGEGVHPLGALLELPRGLRAAQHQYAHHRLLVLAHRQRFRQQVAELRRAGAAGQARVAAALKAMQGVAQHLLVVLHHRVAVGGLVARQERVRLSG